MATARKRLMSLLAAAALAAGCTPPTVAYEVKLITEGCDSGRSPVEGVTYLELRVTGDGMTPLKVKGPFAEPRTLTLPEVPAGTNRRIEARGYAGDPDAGGQLVSLGRSLSITIPDALPDSVPPKVTIFLRRVNAFSRLSSEATPTTCTKLHTPRAGHTATLLPDGRVFVAGGFQMQGQTQRRSALASTEIFYPSKGDFTPAADLAFVSQNGVQYPTPRAFHAATLMDSKAGQVLVTGGETYTDSGSAAPLSFGLVYDPSFNEYGVIKMQKERSRHAAVQEASGRVLLVGGVDKSGAAIPELEWYQSGLTETRQAADATGNLLQLKRVGHSAAAVQGGKYVAVAGGSDGATLQDRLRFLSFDGERFAFTTPEGSSPQLRLARRGGTLVPFRDDKQLLLVGGFDSASDGSFNAVGPTEFIKTGDAFTVADGPILPTPRGYVCAAPLGDGRVLTVGGYFSTQGSVAQSDSSAELISSKSDGSAVATSIHTLDGEKGRHFSTCTLLQDGTVLLLGGLYATGSAQAVLDEAWVFTPAPLD